MSRPRDGILLVDKPEGPSSHAMVAEVRRSLGIRKVGHAGTLDPAASGLMVLGTGAGTRLLTFLVGLDKSYSATIRLGVGTTTEDAQGEVTAAPGCEPGADVAAAMAGLTGDLLQRPSSVSAIKVDGRRAYDRVRRGEEVVLEPRPVRVDRFDLVSSARSRAGGVPVLDLDVVVDVSSGTYIRALARDLGAALGTAAHLRSLRRTRVGPFSVDRAHPVATIPLAAPMSLGTVASAVLPTRTLGASEAAAASLGQRLPAEPAAGPLALLDSAGNLLAIADVEDGRYRYRMVVPLPSDPPQGSSGTLDGP
jgi:tRNA pseudouridine55 synthase